MLMVPVPSLMHLVASIRLAMNIDAGGDVLGRSVDVLADIALGEAELVGEDEGLAVLAQRLSANPCPADGSAW